MNNIWTAIILAVVFVFAGYYLSAYWAPLGWLGFLFALGIVGMYLFGRNQRIQ